MLELGKILDFLHKLAPLELAAEWDNVGLLLGDAGQRIEKIMTCLTVTPESAAEAIDGGANLIVTHHPVLFRPVQKLTSATSEGRMLLSLLKAGIAVYSPHTAFDNAPLGINELLARRLGLVEIGPLRRSEGAGQCKVVVFVPDADLARVSDALFAAGAGNIGQYRECSFRVAGKGTFFGSEATNPTVGQKGRREDVDEWRLEVVCPEAAVGQAVAAMRKAHSYEEPAFDVYSLKRLPAGTGEGRLGRLPEKTSLRALAEAVKIQLKAIAVQVVGDPQAPVHRVAIACGAAAEFLKDAVKARADVFLTGEMRFHDYLSAQAQGIGLILPGHYATERPGIEQLAITLKTQWPELHVWPSLHEADPLSWV